MPPFAARHCAVVGATGLIGSHIAIAFARQGAAVSLLGRSALQARPRLEPDLPPPGPHRFIPLDVADAANIKAVFAAPAPSSDPPAVGPIDVLVNCVGVSQTTLLKRTPDTELADILDTNLLATMLVCKYARIQPHGCIVNVSSLMANKGGYGATAYAASKAGIVAFTRALCREMTARSIRVNALLPGWVESPMWHQLKPELKEAYLKEIPLNRVADAAEVADAAVFLASNRFANNCVLNLDGGMSAA
ncbi:hypothetical protein XA68_16194 [Ophiocordyceps unilateralis]|uniref:Ketoreductase domain-containing protein n=1 Tax=Ophiocordyceps unilateralis TaxID=268505 RepID=A0A2A9P583_OPHUN|nr:hypothetical protein XA68_16194 [Ophiocordyceps unilateralis]